MDKKSTPEQEAERQLQEEVGARIEEITQNATLFDTYLAGAIPTFRGGAKMPDGHWHILGDIMFTPAAWTKFAAKLAKRYPIDGVSDGFGIDGQPRVINDRMCYIRFAIPAGGNMTLRLQMFGGPDNGDQLLMSFYSQFKVEPSAVLLNLVRNKWTGGAGR